MALQYLSPIHRASRQIALYLEPHCIGVGLSTTESHLVLYLNSYSPATASELHRVFGVKRSTLTSMIDRLTEKGWVARELSPTDRRSFLVLLTPAGRKLAIRIKNLVEDLEDKISARVTHNALRGFLAVMKAITEVTEVTVVPAKTRTGRTRAGSKE